MLTGCGGGGGSGDSNTASSGASVDYSQTVLTVSEGVRSITLQSNENVIYGYGCTSQKFYDSNNNLVGGRDFYTGFSLPQPLSAGKYTVVSSEIYSNTYNSNGILFFLSSNYPVENLAFSQQYSLGSTSVKLLKFTLSESKSVVQNTSGAADVHLYDSQLSEVSLTGGGNPTVLPAGTYYFLGAHSGVNNCRYDESGVFSLILL